MQLVVWSLFFAPNKKKNSTKKGDIILKKIWMSSNFLFFGNKSLKFLCKNNLEKNHDTKPFQS